HLPAVGSGRFPVYSKQFNELVDVVNDLSGADGTLQADTITEETSAAGVIRAIVTYRQITTNL
ncbi:MAG TPA: hypothetical protein PKI46_10175, partial [Bacteroidales bacterium]|nr:hypothetical protein [Bacteroidales bacterium]